MKPQVVVELTKSQIAQIEDLMVEATLEKGLILGTVTKRKGEIIAAFKSVPNALALEIIKIAEGENNA